MSFHSLFENSSITLFFPLRLLLTESRKGYLFMSCFTLYSVFKVRLPDKIRISAVFDCSNLYSIPFFANESIHFTKMVGSSGLEPPTSRLSGVRSNHLSYEPSFGGDERVRTDDPLLAKQVLSQLSYTPVLSFRFRTSKIKQRIKDPQSVSALLTRSSAPSWRLFSLERR